MHHDISSIVQANCDLLGIHPPDVKYAPASDFLTPTTIAATRDDGGAIQLNQDIPASTPDLWFSLSHELRHVWQIQRGKLSHSYSDRQGTSVVAYNMQYEEIDANAWAYIMCTEFLHLRPTLETALPPEVVERIIVRAQRISRFRLYG